MIDSKTCSRMDVGQFMGSGADMVFHLSNIKGETRGVSVHLPSSLLSSLISASFLD